MATLKHTSIVPNQIVLTTSPISIDASAALDAESAQGAIGVQDQRGTVRLSQSGKRATWRPESPLSEGQHTLIIDGLSTKSGKPINGGVSVPFFAVSSDSPVPSSLRIESMARFSVGSTEVRRIALGKKPRGRFIEVFKTTHQKTGQPRELAFDENGKKVDWKKLRAELMAAQAKKYGKLHPTLHEKLRKIDANKYIDVAVWLQHKEEPEDRLSLGKTQSAGAPSLVMKQRERLYASGKRFCDSVVKDLGGRRMVADDLAPVVFARVPKSAVSALAKRKDVVGLFHHDTKGIDDLEDSIAIANSDDVHTSGNNGSGVKVAVWERGPDDTSKLTIAGFFDPSQSKKSEHSRHTHAIVKNKESGKPHGHAPSCTLYSANDPSLSALRWAVKDQGCTVISQSFHRSSEPGSSGLSFDDIYKDWLALHWPYPTILQAAGNYWNGDPDNINPPSSEYVNHKGYNSLAVGNHNDSASSMSGSSVFRNPAAPHGDRELPEIAANGTAVTTVGLTKSGTSMAAPAAAGITALLQSTHTSLKFWPEACRAILLAGAKRNITGGTWWQDVVAGNDASDGAGAVDAQEGTAIAKNRRSPSSAASRRGWASGKLTSSDFNSSKLSKFSYKIKVPSFFFGPRHVKVALTWTSKITELNLLGIKLPLSSNLTVDLDLKIYDSHGIQVGYSGSWDNSYEVAEFEAKPGETYTIRIRRWSGTDTTWYGIAWTVTGGLSLVNLLMQSNLSSRALRDLQHFGD